MLRDSYGCYRNVVLMRDPREAQKLLDSFDDPRKFVTCGNTIMTPR